MCFRNLDGTSRHSRFPNEIIIALRVRIDPTKSVLHSNNNNITLLLLRCVAVHAHGDFYSSIF